MPKLNIELSKIWLRSYFDCEGWVTCQTHQNRMIGADCVNKIGIYQIKEALEKIKIKSKLKKRNTRNIFSLQIYGKENLVKFKENINFLHPAKNEKLNQIIKDFVEYKWDYPKEQEKLNNFIKKILKTKAKIKKDAGIVRIISKIEDNLVRLQKELYLRFNIESKVNKRINGIGTVYFELNINKQLQVRSLIDKNLINEIEIQKWKNR